MTFGEKMRSIREEHDWTLEEMADRLGTTKQALSKYERGERTPKITIVAKFAKILNISLPELVGEEPREIQLQGEIAIPFDDSIIEMVETRLTQEDKELEKLWPAASIPARRAALAVLRSMKEGD